jgi:2-octaprenylphenol hydroxylase
VLVVGAGMVGGALACALAGQGRRVALVESQPPAALPTDGFDLRVSALTRASEALLGRIGVWPGMAQRRVSPFREMYVWDAGSNGAIRFDAAEIGEPHLGHIVENRVTVAALEERIARLHQVDWHRPCRPLRLVFGPSAVRLDLGGVELEAELVVAADGAASRVRELAGIPCPVMDYGQQGLVATVRTERAHRETAWQRFLPGGPLAFLPLVQGHSSIVWSVPPEQARELLALSDEQFCAVLTDAFEARLGRVEWVGPRAAFPLRRQHAQQYVQPRLALVGDAAHTIHPLAGQGVNLGLLDAAALAQVLDGLPDAGDLRALRRYERWRRGHNLAVQALMDGFKWLFGVQGGAARVARGLGLAAADRAGPVKRMLMRQAMGLDGDLPDLARPPVRAA